MCTYSSRIHVLVELVLNQVSLFMNVQICLTSLNYNEESSRFSHFIIMLISTYPQFLYARLQTGRIMVWWCPSVRVSVRPSVRPSQFSALFSYMLWHIELKFCVWLYSNARKIKFECHQFPSFFAWVMSLSNFKLLQICSFPHFSPTCFKILSWNFAHNFVLLHFRLSLSVNNLRQFLWELCPFWNLKI